LPELADSISVFNERASSQFFTAKSIPFVNEFYAVTGLRFHSMMTSRRSKPIQYPTLKFGPEDGPAKMSARRMPKEREFGAQGAASSTALFHWLRWFDRAGLSWKMSRASSVQTTEPPLSQLSTSSKKSGIWGYGSRVTLSARAFPTIEKEYSLSALIKRHFPMTSILTAANCLGILRREKRAGRTLDPVFAESLSQTLRFWCNVGEALGTPKQQISAPRYAPKLEDIKEVILTDQYYVARNLTWDECERLMGFPDGWTVDGGDSLATQ
jgi:hypothetical protein